MRIDSLSVFFPAYNEESSIIATVEKAFGILKKLALKNYEITVINDGSKDQTEEKIIELKKKIDCLKLISHHPNKGYGEALKAGFYSAKYPWIVYTDSDGQFDFSEVTKFFQKQEETNADLVIGFYLDRKVGLSTKITTRVWEMLVWIMFGLKVKDIDCAFKLISKKVIEDIPKLESKRGAFISSELLIKAQDNKFKIVEVGISHFERSGGKATGRNLNVIIQSFIDLFKLWWKMKWSNG